jgi:hypothetical protein
MNKKMLLKPRYKVIADWPRMTTYWIGRIFEVSQMGMETQIPYHKYPHLFKKLEWWEERDEKDMPEYVKAKYSFHVAFIGYFEENQIFKLSELEGEKECFNWVEISTEQEYLEYIAKNKKS